MPGVKVKSEVVRNLDNNTEMSMIREGAGYVQNFLASSCCHTHNSAVISSQ